RPCESPRLRAAWHGRRGDRRVPHRGRGPTSRRPQPAGLTSGAPGYCPGMARARKTQDKDVISRLADAGEEALQKLTELPGGKQMLKTMGEVRSRLDDVTTKVRKLDPLERRVAAVERRLDALQKPKTTSTRTRKTAARKTTTRAKRSSSS